MENKKMGYKPTPKTPVDPSALTAPEFRKFLEYFPDAVLKEYKIPGYAFWGVGMALAQHIDYETGTGSRLSQRAIARISRTGTDTVRRVLEFLKMVGAIEVRDLQRRNGKPSENYNFRKSATVVRVLELADQDYLPERLRSETVPHQVQTVPHQAMIRTQDPKIEQGSDRSSPAPVVAQPSARDGAATMDQEEEFDVDAFLEGLVIDL